MKLLEIVTLTALYGAATAARTGDDRDLKTDVWAKTLNRRQTTWSPPSELVTPLQEVWDHVSTTYNNGDLLGFTNYGYDILMASNGTLNFCVRWDSDASVTEADRTAIESSLKANVRKWTDQLTGFMGWPFGEVPVSVVGWAVKDKAQLQGSVSGVDVHTTADSAGTPECDPACGRFFHQDNDYSACAGGAARHYDMSLWLTAGMEGGAGGDWGQRVGSEYFLGALDSPHIWLHEFGHTLALDDFYDWTPTGITNFIMNAGSSTTITDFDIWMMRDFWRHIASRFSVRKLKARAIGKFD
ncbi:hypothetical protein BP5796_06973 [Coleophoma crateriformis]|uniref:Cellulose-binding family ii protein n=1 Tax=Coleophoma crateriformis TaxID=565419 RepID=A0A3D8RPZ1_9HELO|nr:hypothetical protein BP5796_06973 [Coleophoma crateriformis]